MLAALQAQHDALQENLGRNARAQKEYAAQMTARREALATEAKMPAGQEVFRCSDARGFRTLKIACHPKVVRNPASAKLKRYEQISDGLSKRKKTRAWQSHTPYFAVAIWIFAASNFISGCLGMLARGRECLGSLKPSPAPLRLASKPCAGLNHRQPEI